MSQLTEHINPIKPPTRTNKNFVYKGMKYPIDFGLVKKYSNFFYKNKLNFKSIDDIEIKPDNYEVSDQSIQMFVACCQNQPFDITDSNVLSLHQLSIQYEVTVLNDLTSQYIQKNKKSIIFPSILYKLKNRNPEVNIDLSSEEETIAANFFDYINDDQLISLPIPILYRIINNEHLKFNELNSTDQNKYIEFLFKCLDRYKREASVLFLNLDIENERVDLLSQLLSRYSDVFDFNMINPKFLAKKATFLLSELNKLKIEFANKISEIESEFKKQQKFFVSSKNDMLNTNRSLEQKVTDLENQISTQKKCQDEQEQKLAQMEEKLNEQTLIIEKIKNVKVSRIEISNQPKFLFVGSTMTLTALIKPSNAYNDGVKWQIIQENEGTIQVESENKKTLVLKGLKGSKKVKIVATALDGSGVKATKELQYGALKGTIEIKVQQDQSIKGTIKIAEEGPLLLDKSKSRYMISTNNSANLGMSAYDSGFQLDDLTKEVSFIRPKGKYYLHVLVIDNFGASQELISKELEVSRTITKSYGYTGNVEKVELEPGRYKLEAWGAQGGSLNSTYHGGYGGYSTGVINLQSKTALYVVVGKSTNDASGGYNGGGSGGIMNSNGYKFTAYGGGGASHIGFKPGELSSFSGDYSSNLLVAASGGGGATDATGYESRYNYTESYSSIGGCGGGCTGAEGIFQKHPDRVGTVGTQTSGGKAGFGWSECGSFGLGGSCGNHPYDHPGGGGGSGFYGGGSGGNSAPGAGGSGYINTSKLADASMCGYEVPTSSSAEIKTLSTTNVSSDAVSNYAKQGDGYVKITVI